MRVAGPAPGTTKRGYPSPASSATLGNRILDEDTMDADKVGSPPSSQR